MEPTFTELLLAVAALGYIMFTEGQWLTKLINFVWELVRAYAYT